MKQAILYSILFVFFSCKAIKENKKDTLNLSNQNLTTIPKKHLQNSNEILFLNLSINNISNFPIEILEFSNLESLSLSDNPIEKIPDEIKTLSKLRTLDIRTTNIKTLPDLREMKNLTKVVAFGNNLSNAERKKMICAIPKKCKLLFLKDQRAYPLGDCN